MHSEAKSRTPFADLLQRFNAGEGEATNVLFQSYSRVIREAVRRRLPKQLRNEFESIDFAQDVWTEVCENPDRPGHFDDSGHLRAYLIEAAINKVVDAYRRRTCSRNSPRNPVEQFDPNEPALGPDPSPSQWAIAGERWQSIADSLPAPHVALVERIREGFTVRDVAKMAGISPRSVHRILERIQRLCEEVDA